ncbi:aminotransferase class V-fold PLP-dependent enzyme [Laspinema olomoucense]|uniref:aminotransferase class V-fold PLP-dependent enzyme n=1 Tax=Laspinema olomoucense TaxID=3231600 RepID=UPI0021BA9BFF|nr:aminotransferase class V-fold PLP-dependent enzyme [Laspinema sp. D3c]MCT7994385.1 aminotransferase class V-fold PLP-dependent enzyme [Laspinema sp. D3c]
MKQPDRQQFPALKNKAYFNYGGQGPMPESALSAIFQCYQSIQEKGPFTGEAGLWIDEEIAATRAVIASELGVTPDTITLTENVSIGCNIPLWGIDWQPGDRILIGDCEHPGIVAAVDELARRFDLQVSTCPLMETLNEGNAILAIASHLHPTTRLVVLSHILWNTGQVLPLTDIVKVCHVFSQNATPSRKIRVLVDAAQSVGVLPLNLTEIGVDFYAFTGHKWWCGPEGLGGLYVSPDAAETLHPTFISWRSIALNSSGGLGGFKPDGRRFEMATSAYPLLAGLRKAIAFHQDIGTSEERYDRIQSLSHQLWTKLRDLPDIICLKSTPPEAGLVSFQLNETLQQAGATPDKMVKFLERKHRVMVRTILQPYCVRAGVHYLTLESEIERLIEGIQDYCQQI